MDICQKLSKTKTPCFRFVIYISNNLHKYSEQTPQTQNINKLSAVIRSLDPLHGVVENFQRTAS
jgi:hypothetical protein